MYASIAMLTVGSHAPPAGRPYIEFIPITSFHLSLNQQLMIEVICTASVRQNIGILMESSAVAP